MMQDFANIYYKVIKGKLIITKNGTFLNVPLMFLIGISSLR